MSETCWQQQERLIWLFYSLFHKYTLPRTDYYNDETYQAPQVIWSVIVPCGIWHVIPTVLCGI